MATSDTSESERVAIELISR